MNTSLSTTNVDEHRHPPSPVAQAGTRRVSLPDRVALHVGLALITWSRRERTATRTVSDPRDRYQQAAARAERERLWLLALSLSQPRR